MPLDQDVNEAISRLHFGARLPFWAHAVSIQALRLAPTQDWVVERMAAARRCDEGVGTAADVTAKKAAGSPEIDCLPTSARQPQGGCLE